MEAEQLVNELNQISLTPNAPTFDQIMNEAIRQSGNSNRPLDERSIKAFLAAYHFDRRVGQTTDEVTQYSNEVFEVYNQLFELRRIADDLKSTEEHQSGLVTLRIQDLLRDLKNIVERGSIPSYRNAEYCELDTIVMRAALNKAAADGPLRYADLWNLIRGVTPLYIQVKKVTNRSAEGVEVTENYYYAQLVARQGFRQTKPELTDNPDGFSVQLIIDQLNKLRSYIATNKKNEKSSYDNIYKRLSKAIDDLRKENNYPF